MTHALDLALAVETVSAVLYVALGAWVLTLTPRRRQATFLAAFAILFGLAFALHDLGVILHLVEPGGPLAETIVFVPLGLAYAAAFGLAWTVPEPLEGRRLLAAALGVGLALSTFRNLAFYASPLGEGTALSAWVGLPLGAVVFGIRDAVLVLLALRASPTRDHGPGDVAQLALLAVAFAVFGAFIEGGDLVRAARTTATGAPATVLSYYVLGLAPWILAAGLWGWNVIRAGEETVRVHRTTMLAILGFVAAGAVYFAAFPAVDYQSNVMRGVTRTLGIGLLAYGILRHDIAGLDEKVEFGLSKTTVAGIFVAVFFAASEGAQILFADFAGNELIGVAAAALLVFAISPLQRLADRFAAKAVPGGAEAGHGVEERYRKAVELALADGQVSAEERRHLAQRAEELGISHTQAAEIREQVEDEPDDPGAGE